MKLPKAEDEAATQTASRSVVIWRSAIAENYRKAVGLSSERAEEFQRLANAYDRITRQETVMDGEVRSGDDGAPVELPVGDWTICGVSHIGKKKEGEKKVPTNDDAFLIVQSADQVLVAVADGTGDSIDGKRASQVALTALKRSFTNAPDVQRAILAANAAVQQDNERNGLDGACCLACVAAKGGSLAAATVGDTRFTLIGRNNELTHAQMDKLNRHVLGGEPLGDIITSSGNVVKEVTSAEDVQVTGHDNIERFVLCSDGAYVGKDGGAEDNKAIAEFVAKPVRDCATGRGSDSGQGLERL